MADQTFTINKMNISKELKDYLAAPNAEEYKQGLLQSITTDIRTRYPDAADDNPTNALFARMARPVYNERISQLNAELESLKIIKRKKS